MKPLKNTKMPAPAKIHFEISERKILLRSFDLIVVFSVLYLIGYLFEFSYFKININHPEWMLVLGFYLMLFGTIFEIYDLKKASRFDAVFKNILLTASVTVLVYMLTPFFTPALPYNRLQIVYFFIAIAASLVLWRWAYITLISSPRFYKKILLIGDVSDAVLLSSAMAKTDPNFKVIGLIQPEFSSNDLPLPEGTSLFSSENISQTVNEQVISEIVVSERVPQVYSMKLYSQLLKLLEEGVVVKDFTQVYEEITYKVPLQHINKDFYKYFPFSRSNQNRLYRVIHHLIDYFLCVLGLLLMVLLIPFVFLGNLAGNRGPLFYTQERVGKNARIFNIIKFRTMVVNAEGDGAVWAEDNDNRITPFGRFLRKTRIDEIPQVINVLKGHMSIIGPRPERPEFVEQLTQEIPFYEVRHIIRPGLTGWAQVKGRYTSSKEGSEEKLQYDLYYIKKRSLFLDVNILLKTLSTVIFFRGN